MISAMVAVTSLSGSGCSRDGEVEARHPPGPGYPAAFGGLAGPGHGPIVESRQAFAAALARIRL